MATEATLLVCRGWIIGADNPRITPDDRDAQILADRVQEWNKRAGPRVGDWLIFADGVMHRFSHDWEEHGLQTSKGGSFYLDDNGYASFSGGLNPCVPRDKVLNSGQTRLGRFWFFHHDYMTAHAAVNVELTCRVFATELYSNHWQK